MQPHMMHVPANLLLWQAEADCLPLEELQEKVTTGLVDFEDKLYQITTNPDLNEHCPCGCGKATATVPDHLLIDMITAGVSVAVHLLGVALRVAIQQASAV